MKDFKTMTIPELEKLLTGDEITGFQKNFVRSHVATLRAEARIAAEKKPVQAPIPVKPDPPPPGHEKAPGSEPGAKPKKIEKEKQKDITDPTLIVDNSDEKIKVDKKKPKAPPKTKLPVIELHSDKDVPAISEELWNAVVRRNEKKPNLFRHGSKPRRISVIDDGMLTDIDFSLLKFEADRSAFFRKWINGGNWKQESAPGEVIKDMLSHPEPPLPILRRVVSVPVFVPGGRLIDKPGYDTQSGIYYLPSANKPVNPEYFKSSFDAAAWFFDEILVDFPFVSSADEANIIAAILIQVCREMIEGPTPIHLVEASCPGSGKDLLIKVITEPFGRIYTMTEGENDAEWRKKITAAVRDSSQRISLTNANRTIDSGSLAAFITCDYWTDRILGKSETITIRNDSVIFATANNPTFSKEIARRVIRTRIVPDTDRPWNRTGFKHANLTEFALQNENKIRGVAYTLVKNWVNDGMPLWSGKPLGSFESYSKIIGGILEHAGVAGFLENRNTVFETAEDEAEPWRKLCYKWWRTFSVSPQGVKSLYSLALEIEDLDLGNGTPRSMRTRFGKMLKKRQDMIFDGFQILYAGTNQGATFYKLKKTEEDKSLEEEES